jgi:hypothetical protein
MVGGEEVVESWKNQVTDLMRNSNMEEDMAEDFGVWEWMDGSWLYRSKMIMILIIITTIIIHTHIYV